MISRICGRLKHKKENSLLLELDGGLCYEVLVPRAVMRALDKQTFENGKVELVTFYYHQVKPDRNVPILIGFLNEIEREFFECFITVSGVGPKAALRALNRPISIIARAIDQGDMKLLCSLPGIGQQRAREIIAKLQGKVGKFALIRDEISEEAEAVKENIAQEALEILYQLQYKKPQAKEMIQKALQKRPDVASVEELLNEVYRQKQ